MNSSDDAVSNSRIKGVEKERERTQFRDCTLNVDCETEMYGWRCTCDDVVMLLKGRGRR